MAKNCEEYVLEQLEKKDKKIEELEKENQELRHQKEELLKDKKDLFIVARVFSAISHNMIEGVSINFSSTGNIHIPPLFMVDYNKAVEIVDTFDFMKEVGQWVA